MTRLRLSVPDPGWGVLGAVIEQWHVEPGGAVRPGDLLVSLRVAERVRPLASQDATKLLSRHWQIDPLGLGPDALIVEVMAGEPGWLETIAASTGAPVEIGALLGTVTTTEQLSAADEAAPAMVTLLEYRAFAEVRELTEDLDAIS